MTPTYASGTDVSSSRSREEIERTVAKFGADQFISGFDKDRAMVAFTINGRQVRFILPLPDRNDPAFAKTPTGQKRTANAAAKAWDQSVRESWRALAAVIKAKLIAVDAQIVSFEQEFAMHMVLPNGSTVAEAVLPAIERAYATGGTPNLLAIEGPR